MDIQTFKRLKKMVENELSLDENDISTMSFKIPNLYQKYLDIFSNEFLELNNLEVEIKSKFGELYKKYKYKDDYEWSNKNEIESQIHSNEDFRNLRIRFNEQEFIVKYLEKTLENINRLSFSLKNYIDIMKFKHGML